LGMAVAAKINELRGSVSVQRNAYIVSSIKHPDEVKS